MVLNKSSLFLFIVIISILPAGCMTRGGYERYGVYEERNDRIHEHRASFIEDGSISMAYTIAYWDVVQEREEKDERIPESFYIWIRNNTSQAIVINPENLSLQTDNGVNIPLSRITGNTREPFKENSIEEGAIASGYAVFEIPSELINTDRPSRLVYDDRSGIRAIRYLQVEDMKRYEGLIVESQVYYYAPVYPRYYWYPHYYPYSYYPYDIQIFYYYKPYRRYYYNVPAEPGKRQFYTPSAPDKREFKEEKEEREKEKKKRSFP